MNQNRYRNNMNAGSRSKNDGSPKRIQFSRGQNSSISSNVVYRGPKIHTNIVSQSRDSTVGGGSQTNFNMRNDDMYQMQNSDVNVIVPDVHLGNDDEEISFPTASSSEEVISLASLKNQNHEEIEETEEIKYLQSSKKDSIPIDSNMSHHELIGVVKLLNSKVDNQGKTIKSLRVEVGTLREQIKGFVKASESSAKFNSDLGKKLEELGGKIDNLTDQSPPPPPPPPPQDSNSDKFPGGKPGGTGIPPSIPYEEDDTSDSDSNWSDKED